MICVFTRRITDELASLVRQIDIIMENGEIQKLAAFVVLLAEDVNSAEEELRSLAKNHKITRVPLTVFNGTDGPPNYAITEQAEVTVLKWGGEKKLVRVNHAFGSGQLNETLIAKVVSDISAPDDEKDVVVVGVYNTPITIKRLQQIGLRTDIESLDLQDVNLTAAAFRHLRGLAQLRSLNLFRNKNLTDESIETLVRFQQLEHLNVSSTRVTNAGVKQLAGKLTQLKSFNCRNSRLIDDEGLRHLHQRPRLEMLLCGNTSISDAGLEHVSNLASLRELEVRKTRITDAGLAHLRKLTRLENLNCSDNRITSEGVRHFSALTELRSLDLSQTRIDDAALSHLSRMVHLEHLDLSRTWIAGQGLRHLHKLQSLRFVNLFGTKATAEHVATLQHALPTCEVVR